MKYIVSTLAETDKVAKKLVNKLTHGGIVALVGPLGAGKTTLAKSLAKSLKIKDRLISPTFILHRIYPIPSRPSSWLHHLDLYRINAKDTKGLGLEEIYQNPRSIVLIEWAEKLNNLPPHTIWVTITPKEGGQREIEIKNY